MYVCSVYIVHTFTVEHLSFASCCHLTVWRLVFLISKWCAFAIVMMGNDKLKVIDNTDVYKYVHTYTYTPY